MRTEFKSRQKGERRQRRSVETANRIFHHALRCFREKGFNSCSTEEITTRAGVAKGTFFVYFPTKEDVLLQFVNTLAAQYEVLTRLAHEKEYGGHELLSKLFCQPASWVGRNVLLLSSLLYVLIGTDASHSSASGILTTARQYLSEVCSHAKQAGEIRTEVDNVDFADKFLATLLGALLLWTVDPTWDLQEQLEQRFDFFWEGFRSS